MVKGKHLNSVLFAIPLFFIKFQNFYLQILFVFIYYFFNVRDGGMSLRKFLVLLVILLGASTIVFPYIVDDLNKYRIAMHIEDGGLRYDITYISDIRDFVEAGTISGLLFLLKPLPWEANGLLQMFQSFENIAVFAFIIYLIRRAALIDAKRMYYWLLYLASFCATYSIVVSNYGTSARYKFTFVSIFIVFLSFEYIRKPNPGDGQDK